MEWIPYGALLLNVGSARIPMLSFILPVYMSVCILVCCQQHHLHLHSLHCYGSFQLHLCGLITFSSLAAVLFKVVQYCWACMFRLLIFIHTSLCVQFYPYFMCVLCLYVHMFVAFFEQIFVLMTYPVTYWRFKNMFISYKCLSKYSICP
jgi:hypothetical protein